METERLRNPIWHAVNQRQGDIALTANDAVRYQPEISMLAGTRDLDDLSPLKQLVSIDEVVLIFSDGLSAADQQDWQEMGALTVRQMVHPPADVAAPDIAADITPLMPQHDEAMLALAQLTEPGPFELHTRRMGRYYGVFHDDTLMAMSGERILMPGLMEVSGVCTHPDARGKGYAAQLVSLNRDLILADGEAAFLHVRLGSPSEASATALYERLGFEHFAFHTVRAIQRIR